MKVRKTLERIEFILHTYTAWLSSVGRIKFHLKYQENLKLNTEKLYFVLKEIFVSVTMNQTFTGVKWYFNPYSGLYSLVQSLVSKINNTEFSELMFFYKYYDIKFSFPFYFISRKIKWV